MLRSFLFHLAAIIALVLIIAISVALAAGISIALIALGLHPVPANIVGGIVALAAGCSALDQLTEKFG